MNKCIAKRPITLDYMELASDEDMKKASLVIPRSYVNALGKLYWEVGMGTNSASVGDFVVMYPSGQYFAFKKEQFEEHFLRASQKENEYTV